MHFGNTEVTPELQEEPWAFPHWQEKVRESSLATITPDRQKEEPQGGPCFVLPLFPPFQEGSHHSFHLPGGDPWEHLPFTVH